MAYDYDKMAKQVLKYVGGKSNLTAINHCATRLRLGVKDVKKVNRSELSKIDGVLGVEIMPDQIQVVVGQIIEDLYNSFLSEAGEVGSASSSSSKPVKKKKNIGTLFISFLELVAKIMAPVLPPLICAGFFACILIVGHMFFHLATTSSTYIILNSLGQTALYFLPVMVAYTSARQFHTNPVLAIMLACFLLYPDWTKLVAKGSATGFTSYFGLPVHLQAYNGQVVQIILSVWVMSLIDKWLDKHIPNVVKYFLKPVLLMLIMSIITLTVTGPLGGLFTNGIAAMIAYLRRTVPWLTVPVIYLFAMTVGVFMPGFHLALIPIATQNFATLGYDDIINIWFCAGTMVPGFVALWVALKTKSIKGKNISWAAAISALFGGISEPTVYGILYKIPVLYGVDVITGLIVSIYNGIVGTKAFTAYGAYYLTNFLLFYSPKYPTNIIKAAIMVLIIAVCTFIGVWFTNWSWNDTATANGQVPSFKQIFSRKQNTKNSTTEASSTTETNRLSNVTISAPVAGSIITQSEIKDHAFSSGMLGKCFGVNPTSDDIYSPVDGVINSVAATKHAITIKGNNGEDVMLHLTLDSMKVKPDDISVLVKVGDHVANGQRVAILHRDKLKARHIDDTVITVLLNTKDYKNVNFNDGSLVAVV